MLQGPTGERRKACTPMSEADRGDRGAGVGVSARSAFLAEVGLKDCRWGGESRRGRPSTRALEGWWTFRRLDMRKVE